jgi:cyclin-dependent kinase
MPDWGKMNFHEHSAKPWEEILPGVPADARDLVAKLVCYSSSRRLSAHSVGNHSLGDNY